MLYKLTFSILLISNTALFIWGYQRPIPQFQPPPSPPPLDAPSIKLVSELTPPTAISPEKKIAPVPVLPICIRLGPLYGQQEALELAKMLESVGQTTKLETETALQNGGFWLVIKAKKSKTDSMMAQLNVAGIIDVWIFDEGPLKGMISLGLYSSEEDADKRRKSLYSKGFSAEIRQRDIEVSNYWVITQYLESNTEVKKVVEKAHELYPHLTSPPPHCKSFKNQ